MASERQIAANRANAKRSTGPKTRAGTQRASQNAYRHGLSARARVDAEWFARIEELAQEIANSMNGEISLSRARSIAEAECEVRRVRSMKTAVIRQILAGLDDSEWSVVS